MSQSTSTRLRNQSQPSALLYSRLPDNRITRSMLLKACDDVDIELQRLLRRQRWLNLEKSLHRAVGR